MRSRPSIRILTFLFLLSALFAVPARAQSPVLVLDVKGIIGQAMKNYVIRGIRMAEESGAPCVILRIDTPGGLMDSMKDMSGVIVTTKVPVVVYVAPRGSTATSAGFFLLMASDFAVMAPGTSAGSAHPVSTEGPMDKTTSEKATNYATAYMKTLVERRGRNIPWAEKAVRRSVSATAADALRINVVDFLADSIPDLLRKLDGKKLTKNKKTVTLRTRGADVREVPMSPREQFFQIFGHPNLAYILLTVGMYGIIFEVTHPGAIFPGVIGVVCLLLAFTAFQVIPINTFGLALIIAGIALFAVEVKLPTHGISALSGAVVMFIGSLMLVDSADPAARVSISVILSVVGTTAFFFLVAIAAVVRTLKGRVTTGQQGMIGLRGRALHDVEPEGMVFVNGEHWRARSMSGETIPEGTAVEVVAVEGMTLTVKQAES